MLPGVTVDHVTRPRSSTSDRMISSGILTRRGASFWPMVWAVIDVCPVMGETSRSM
jgi:hypothetical protein